MKIESILDDEEVNLATLASECRGDKILRAEVAGFIKKSGIGKIIKDVVSRSGTACVGPMKAGVAEAVFAQGALVLTLMAIQFIGDLRREALANGHSGKPNPLDSKCLFQSGHPIKVANAISVDFVPQEDAMVSAAHAFMSAAPLAEA